MSDVLAITVPLGSRYASVNGVGRDNRRGGRKSDAYKRLYADVKAAAEAEIARTGWTTATANCFAMIVRYVPGNRRCDAMNQGKCEWDALTAAGVWDDDRWANPSLPWIVPNAGEHRIAIVVVKLAAQAVPARAEEMLARKQTPRRRAEAGASAALHPIVERMAKLNGKPIPLADALEMIRK